MSLFIHEKEETAESAKIAEKIFLCALRVLRGSFLNGR
jgi:hypothetical protein